MAKVVVWNPHVHGALNPRKKKAFTREQVEKRQAKAVRFAADVLEDDNLADELESLTPEEYAEKKGLRMNPAKKRKETKSMKRGELKQVVKDAVSEAIKQTRRSNPNGQQAAPTVGTGNGNGKEALLPRGVLDAVRDAADAVAEDDQDEALDILDGVLDRYEDDES